MAAIIERLLAGRDSIESDLVNFLIYDSGKGSRPLATKLSKRELAVLALAGDGAVNKSIAETLEMSAAYVGNIMAQIFRKLDLRETSDINPRVAACREYFREYGFGEAI
jgi:DNA-binding NarL/FixJ family response regulator